MIYATLMACNFNALENYSNCLFMSPTKGAQDVATSALFKMENFRFKPRSQAQQFSGTSEMLKGKFDTSH